MGWAGLIAVKVAREGCDRLSGRQPGKPGGGGRGWVVGSWQSALLFSQRDRILTRPSNPTQPNPTAGSR